MIGAYTLSIDYLSGSFPVHERLAFATALRSFFGAFERESKGFNYHNTTFRFSKSAAVTFSVDGEDRPTKDHACVDLRGDALRTLWSVEVRDLLQVFATYGVKFTRIDVAFDDHEKIIRPHEVWERYAAKGLTTGPKPDYEFSNIAGQYTAYFGKRGREGCGAMLAIYDKFIESKGENDSVRWEVRFSKEKAQTAWAYILGMDCLPEPGVVPEVPAPEIVLRRLGELVCGVVDFWEADGTDMSDRHTARRVRAPWWETIRGWLRRG